MNCRSKLKKKDFFYYQSDVTMFGQSSRMPIEGMKVQARVEMWRPAGTYFEMPFNKMVGFTCRIKSSVTMSS